MTTEPEVHIRPTSYDVSIWPPGIECMDSDTWKITVEARGHGKWAVMRGRACLGSDGTWEYEPRPSAREDDWLATHRFSFDAALELARFYAPAVTVNDMTAAEVLARHHERYPDGNCGG